jgi:hypothetical protein
VVTDPNPARKTAGTFPHERLSSHMRPECEETRALSERYWY